MAMVKLKYIFVIAGLLTFGLNIHAHPIKMSVGKLEVNTAEHTCRFTLNLFIDDFEVELLNMNVSPPYNYNKPEEDLLNAIEQYILSNFELTFENTGVAFELSSVSNTEENVCQVVFTGKIKEEQNYKTVTIRNTILFDLYKKQSNIIHLIIDDSDSKSLQFYREMPSRTEKL